MDAFMVRIYIENTNLSKFKEKIPQYIKIITWTIEGLGKKLAETGVRQNEKEFQARILDEFDKYTQVLKEAFYIQDDEEELL